MTFSHKNIVGKHSYLARASSSKLSWFISQYHTKIILCTKLEHNILLIRYPIPNSLTSPEVRNSKFRPRLPSEQNGRENKTKLSDIMAAKHNKKQPTYLLLSHVAQLLSANIWGKGPLNPIIITIHRGMNIVKILVLVIAIIHPESVCTVLAHPTIFRSHAHHSSVVLPLALILRTAWRQNFFICSIFLVRYSANTSFDKFN